MRAGFAMSQDSRPEVQKEVEFYARYDDFIARATERARPYLHQIVESIEKRQMPTEIALLPIVESAFRPQARSRTGAVGVWQFMPGTAKRFGLARSKIYDGRRDVLASTEAALDYLQALHDEFDNDWLNAIAAYNCGERNVEDAIEANRAAGKPIDFWSLDLPKETRLYVPRLLALSVIVSTPRRYDLALASIPNAQFLTQVDVSRQIDLEKAAARVGMDGTQLRDLNPGYARGITVAAGVHRVAVPVAYADKFRKVLISSISELQPSAAAARRAAQTGDAGTQRHRIRAGENLGVIANRYDVTVEALRELNEVNPKRLRIGQVLLIPTSARNIASTQHDEAADSAAVEAVSQTVSMGAETPSSGRKVIHTVRAGDTLWTIARGYDVHVKDIVAWNSGLTPKTVLRLNQKLVVWTATVAADVVAIAPTPAKAEPVSLTATDRNLKLVRYEVRTGDSLWTIAQRYGVAVEQLSMWNGIEINSVLKPGARIDVYVVSTDTLADASRI
ncbi:MAG: LysM peptidoglycan-binding domain-containing protein [Gammaproteobacteria bacterium]